MKRSLQKITLTFILISLIPVGFLIHQISSLNTNQKIITEAYQNQLDAILYSVNQYTDDVFSSWANKIDISLLRNENSDSLATREKRVEDFMQMSSVMQIYLTDLKNHQEILITRDSVMNKDQFEKILSGHRERIEKLRSYQQGGFRKIEAVDTLMSDQFIPLYFFLDEDIKEYRMAIIVLDLTAFIQSVLAPKLQAVSQGKFVISAFDRSDNSLIYTTDNVHPGQFPEGGIIKQQELNDATKKELWLLPGYYLAISVKDATVADLVKETVSTSLVIFGALFLLLIAGMVFLYRNIRKEMRLSEAKSEFVSNVSHEIRTPLSLISMYAETLEMDRVPQDRKKEYYAIIRKETERLAGIVNRILNFASLDASKNKIEFKKIDLQNVCTEILDSYRPHFAEKGFSFEFQGGGEALIMGDEESIKEALINLIDNAMKYSLDKKRIVLQTGKDNSFHFVRVSDEGIGIPKEFQKHVFEQFYRVPANNIHATKGTGLGLALVKKTIAAHKGKILLESTPDQGSTFTLYFPSALV